MDERHHSHQYIKHIQRIREHVRILNHSSERMTEEISDLSERVAAIEAHMSWLMRLTWIVLGAVIMVALRIYGV